MFAFHCMFILILLTLYILYIVVFSHGQLPASVEKGEIVNYIEHLKIVYLVFHWCGCFSGARQVDNFRLIYAATKTAMRILYFFYI